MEESKVGGGHDRQAVAASNDGVMVGACEISLLVVWSLPSKRWGMELDIVEHGNRWVVVVAVDNPLCKNSCDASSGWASD